MTRIVYPSSRRSCFFYETQNGSQPALGAWPIAYTAYYNRFRSHQASENQTLVDALELERINLAVPLQ